MTPTQSRAGLVLATAWCLAIAAVVATRWRGEWEPYKALHRSMSDAGIPGWLRNFDAFIIFMGAAFLGALFIARIAGGRVREHLLLGLGQRGWPVMAAVSLAPMLVGGLIMWLAFHRGGAAGGSDAASGAAGSEVVLASIMRSVVRAPLMEEFLFRGLLVAAVICALGRSGVRAATNAVLAAALFGLLHVDWTLDGVTRGWPALLVTMVGGLWFAWLMLRWNTIWVPVVLHAGMNLGWFMLGAGGGAGGGGALANLLRAATIVIAIAWTMRATRPIR